MIRGNKGLSPIVATLLLILIAVIIAGIIFFWVKLYIPEVIQKNLGGGNQPIQDFCQQVSFTADASIDTSNNFLLSVQNNGQVPIYGIEIKRKGFASVSTLGEVVSHYGSVQTGDTYIFGNVPGELVGLPTIPNVDDDILLDPVLLGQGSDAQKAYPCDDKYGAEVKVAAAAA